MAKKDLTKNIKTRGTDSIYDGEGLSLDELEILETADNPDELGFASIKETGIAFVEDLTFEQWQALGEHIRRRVDGYQWAIGDFINAGKEEWGDYYTTATEITGYSVSSLRKFSMVSEKYSLFRRRNNLTYSHHLEAMLSDDPDHWLIEAENRNLSVRQLRDEIGAVKQLPQPQKSPYSSLTKKAISLSKSLKEDRYKSLPDSEKQHLEESLIEILQKIRQWNMT